MNIDFVILADDATRDAEGKLTLEGPGVTMVRSDVLPVAVPMIVVVIGLRVDPQDIDLGHWFEVRWLRPDDKVFRHFRRTEVSSEHFRLPAEGVPQTLALVVRFTDITFDTVGNHRIQVEVDSETHELQLAVLSSASVERETGAQPGAQGPQGHQ